MRLSAIPVELRSPLRTAMPLIYLATLIQTGGLLLFAWGLSQHLSSVLLAGQLAEESWTWILILGITLRLAAQGMESVLCGRSSAQAQSLLRQSLLNSLQNRHWVNSTSTFSSAFGRVPLHLADFVQVYLPARIRATLFPVIFIVVFLYNDWLSSVILLVATPFLVILLILTGMLSEKKRRQKWQQLSLLRQELLSQIRGLATIRQLQAHESLFSRVQNTCDSYRLLTMQVLQVVFLSALVLEVIATVSTALIAVQAAIRLSNGYMEYSTALFVLILIPEFFRVLREMGAARHSAMEWEESSRMYSCLRDNTLWQAEEESDVKKSPIESAMPNKGGVFSAFSWQWLVVIALLLGFLTPMAQTGSIDFRRLFIESECSRNSYMGTTCDYRRCSFFWIDTWGDSLF
jgi:ATP-binding cassette, subfamily C, bacterial CydD